MCTSPKQIFSFAAIGSEIKMVRKMEMEREKEMGREMEMKRGGDGDS